MIKGLTIKEGGGGEEEKEEGEEEEETRAALQYRVIWFVPKEQQSLIPMAELPSHFRIKALGGGQLLHHLSVMAHDRVKAVVSHCGLGAAQEALFFGKPLLCLPAFADQRDVAIRVVDAGAGLSFDQKVGAKRFKAPCIRKAMDQLLDNQHYTQQARRLSRHFREAGGLKTAVQVLESALRVGTAHLRPAELDIPWHKANMYDVYVMYSGMIALVAALLICLWRGVSLYISTHPWGGQKAKKHDAASSAAGEETRNGSTDSEGGLGGSAGNVMGMSHSRPATIITGGISSSQASLIHTSPPATPRGITPR